MSPGKRDAGSGGSSGQKNPTRRELVVLHWFRNGDLRLRDNPALCRTAEIVAAAASSSSSPSTTTYDGCHVIPFFCYDVGGFFGSEAKTPLAGSLKCGPKRAKFILESVADLRANLRSQVNSDLAAVRAGSPADAFESILAKMKDAASEHQLQLDVKVVCQEEVAGEELKAARDVHSVLRKHFPQKAKKGKTRLLEQVWGSTMYELADLPWYESDGNNSGNNNNHLEGMPDVFTPFRNKVEKSCAIPKPVPSPKRGSLPLPSVDSPIRAALSDCFDCAPTLHDLGYADDQIEFANEPYDGKGVLNFVGGETAALRRVDEYVWKKDLLRHYFDTRNGMLGGDYSTKLSPWLAHGNLSPRAVAAECRKYEQERVANKSTYWVVFELLWRDYCKFFARKHGDRIFHPSGTAGKNSDKKKKWSTFPQNFEAWTEGKTGYPLVDANMREMKSTGFMSNRGRQNVASFLAIDLNHDWRYGGDWFESNLLDYDVYSNWVNWCAAAGMTGGRLNRFNIVKQSKDYDQNGDYVRHWLPELANVPNEFVHEPWKMTQFQQMEYSCRLGVDYPNPIVPPSKGPPAGGGGGGRGNKNNSNRQRKPKNSNRNRHQKYEMKSVKQGSYRIDG